MSFESLNLPAPLLRAVTDAGYEQATEVQAQAIPLALGGADLRVSSATGSGKTAAFIIPALDLVLKKREAARAAAAEAGLPDPTPSADAPAAGFDGHRKGPRNPRQGRGGRFDRRDDRRDDRRGPQAPAVGPHVLVLAPTRELAQQVARAAETYGRHVPGLRVGLVVGGMPYPAQLRMLRESLDILIATPGRLIDHLESRAVRFDAINMLVLDEADRMLDMGFIEDIEHIAKALPAQRQTLMFSATFAGPVGRLADELMRPQAQRVEVSSHTERHDHIAQELLWADDLRHKDALLDHILTGVELEQAVVFTSTQRDADDLANRLSDAGHAVAPLHGGMPQGLRNRTLLALRRGELRVLVATDVAARGIDVPSITHVVNYGLPMKAEDYVHRIGRTGRAGRSGTAITLAEARDAGMIRRIQHFTTQAIPVKTRDGLEPRRNMPRIDLLPRHPRSGPRPGYHGAQPHGNGFERREGRFDNRFEPRGEHRGEHRAEHRGEVRHDPRFERPHDRAHGTADRLAERHGDRFQDRSGDRSGDRFAHRSGDHAHHPGARFTRPDGSMGQHDHGADRPATPRDHAVHPGAARAEANGWQERAPRAPRDRFGERPQGYFNGHDDRRSSRGPRFEHAAPGADRGAGEGRPDGGRGPGWQGAERKPFGFGGNKPQGLRNGRR